MSTTVSRRRFFVKLKRKLGLPKRVSQNDKSEKRLGSIARFSTPLLYVVRPQEHWWRDWKTVILMSSLIVATAGGLFLLVQNIAADDNSSDKVLPISATTSPGSKVSSLRGSNFRIAGGKSDASNRGSLSIYSPSTDDSFRAAFDSYHKIVLPKDISGECEIGVNGIQDLNKCLIAKGALAQ
jgi:hypothetical protein